MSVLSRLSSRLSSYEFSNYAPWAGRQFPRSMLAREGGASVVEVRVEELAAAAALDPSLFVPPAGAVAWGWCDGAAPPYLLDRPHPQYPFSARHERVQGTVSVYAVIETNGRLQGLTVVRSVAASLDQATLKALERWRYQPAKCGGDPVPMETVIDVTYGLRQ